MNGDEEEVTVFERLEYGSLCISPDGPIEAGVGSYPLAMSEGFPRGAEPFCRPEVLGVREVAAGAAHATVLRCLRIDGALLQVFCRQRLRPAGGEGKPGRRFWRARFLCGRAGVPDPLAGFRALESSPLRGMTVQESKQVLAPLEVLGRPRLELDELAEAFLQRALELVLSGIPVGIAGGVDERTFFRQASALWSLLPPPLRVLFSAGWSVPAAEAARLSLSAAPGFPPSVGVFDALSRRWRLPTRVDQVQVNGEPRSRLFDEDQLVPGRMFLREAFTWKEGRPCLGEQELRLGYLDGFDYGIEGSGPKGVLDARSVWVRERLRRPGLRSLDYARIQELGKWLQGIWEGDPAILCSSTSQYFFPDARRQVFACGLAAMELPEQRPRGGQVIWHSLLDDRSCHALLDSEQIASDFVLTRARLMRSLALGGWPAVLNSVEKAVEHSAALDLPREVAERLSHELTASLDDAGSLEHHSRLLMRLEIPEPYRSWAVACAVRLALALVTAEDPGLEPPLRRLGEISSDQAVAAMLHLYRAHQPAEGDVVSLRALAPGDAKRLVGNLLTLWHRRHTGTPAHRHTGTPAHRHAGRGSFPGCRR